MDTSRRKFMEYAAITASVVALPSSLWGSTARSKFDLPKENSADFWLELSRKAYHKNAEIISTMANQKPVLAVIKNNAYGLGDVEVAKILDTSVHIEGFALVKADRALALRKAGIKKNILLMGDFDESLGQDLVENDIVLSIFSAHALQKIKSLSNNSKKQISTALYIDTGLGRMGIPFNQAFELATAASGSLGLNIKYTFSTLTTPKDFAKEQIRIFNELIQELSREGVNVGKTHLAPSFSLIDLPSSHQDMVRPGILIHGSYPLANMDASKKWPLMPTYRLKSRVMRLEKLSAGDTIGFSRFYKVTKDEWIATLPIGWGDGYDSGAENGAKVLLNGALYSVINVNANHTNISLGANTMVKVGDIATLIGPEKPEITPEGFGKLVKRHNYLQINYKESIPKLIFDVF
ncbi:alanine racemase [Allomuricauda sp. XS_ASV26]|uniref:alanine racemase n=1 Tax=Allomuricauda sp. XS_ASV26 TaxID=3241292 RepID=UPI003518F260